MRLLSGSRVKRNYKTKISNPKQALVSLTCVHNTQHHWVPLSATNFLFNPRVLRKSFHGLRELESRFVVTVRLSLSDGGEIRFLIKKQDCDPREGKQNMRKRAVPKTPLSLTFIYKKCRYLVPHSYSQASVFLESPSNRRVLNLPSWRQLLVCCHPLLLLCLSPVPCPRAPGLGISCSPPYPAVTLLLASEGIGTLCAQPPDFIKCSFAAL